MAQFRRLDVLNAIMESGLIPIFYHEDPVIAQQIVDACACAVGMGSGLIRHDWVLSAQMHKITAAVSRVCGWIAAQKQAQSKQRPLDSQS